ncbi:MAG: hypothetical protein F6K36_14815 [Symploca sp. SIO3C6]|nr:hypothetical protein [Symploca sp. SIO3C6]
MIKKGAINNSTIPRLITLSLTLGLSLLSGACGLDLKSSEEINKKPTPLSDAQVYYRASDNWRTCSDQPLPAGLPKESQEYAARWFKVEEEEIQDLASAQARFKDSGQVHQSNNQPLTYFLHTLDAFVITFEVEGLTDKVWRVCVNPVAET